MQKYPKQEIPSDFVCTQTRWTDCDSTGVASGIQPDQLLVAALQRCSREGFWSGKYTYARFFSMFHVFFDRVPLFMLQAFPVCYVIVYHLNCCLPPLHVFATSKPQLPSTSRPAVGPLILRETESVGVSTWYTWWVPRCIRVPCSIKWTRWFEGCLFFLHCAISNHLCKRCPIWWESVSAGT